MGGSPKPPKPTDEQRKNEEAQRQMLEDQKKQAERQTLFQIPKIKPLRPPPPPAIQTSTDVAQAEEDARRMAAKRTNSARGTLFAGETGGYRSSLGGQRTLLG
jgi:hypothetical protein